MALLTMRKRKRNDYKDIGSDPKIERLPNERKVIESHLLIDRTCFQKKLPKKNFG
jgi:hypothetical protein